MNFYQQVYQLVKKIPRGKVATYGQIASIISTPRAARMVGWALHLGDIKKVPWQRVINSCGMISTTCLDHPKEMQVYLLRSEGVEVNEKQGNYYIDLNKFLWRTKC